MKAPWWFCCGWWSPWCVLDTFGHFVIRGEAGEELPWPLGWICDRHDASIMKETCDG